MQPSSSPSACIWPWRGSGHHLAGNGEGFGFDPAPAPADSPQRKADPAQPRGPKPGRDGGRYSAGRNRLAVQAKRLYRIFARNAFGGTSRRSNSSARVDLPDAERPVSQSTPPRWPLIRHRSSSATRWSMGRTLLAILPHHHHPSSAASRDQSRAQQQAWVKSGISTSRTGVPTGSLAR